MPTHVFSSNSYDSLIASRKLDDTLMSFNVQECNMENQFKLVIIYYLKLLLCIGYYEEGDTECVYMSKKLRTIH